MRRRRSLAGLLLAAIIAVGTGTGRAELTIRLLAVTSPVRRGDPARVEILTTPAAVCDIGVVYRSGPSRAPQLRPRRADGAGRVVWLWRVGRQAAPGRAVVTIECLLGEQITSLRTEFTVR
ncbi:MAG: hypothetical protein QN141_14060 [Armatimonadota bacterium]|nr:hypothetical protein [Armatimonadota bacterium]MDR7452564.1 hypothetical protein [Armatimonadota bacterium]MDR7466894.1 hypothetical protein [Armatimonadota bacterium]MDR7492633.1 hypothetical protein [Armatimonadota bacterium]MDR7500005.1 hypothetical protein [Armatimonadota bacterium]